MCAAAARVPISIHPSASPEQRSENPTEIEIRILKAALPLLSEHPQKLDLNKAFFDLSFARQAYILDFRSGGSSVVLFLQTTQGHKMVLKIARQPNQNPTLQEESERTKTLHKLLPDQVLKCKGLYHVSLGGPLSCGKCCNKRLALLFNNGGPNVYESLIQANNLSEKILRVFATQLANFSCALAQHQLALGDVKPLNMLVTNQDPLIIKFIDIFDLHKVGDPASNWRRGTDGYRSPTVLTKKYNFSLTPFGAACSLFAIITGHHLFLYKSLNITSHQQSEDCIKTLIIYLSQVFLFIPPTQEFIDSISPELIPHLFEGPPTPTTFKAIYPEGFPNSPERFLERFHSLIDKANSIHHINLSDVDVFKTQLLQFLTKYLNYNNPPQAKEDFFNDFTINPPMISEVTESLSKVAIM